MPNPVAIPAPKPLLAPLDPKERDFFSSWLSNEGLGADVLSGRQDVLNSEIEKIKSDLDKRKTLDAEKKLSETLGKINPGYKKSKEKSEENGKREKEDRGKRGKGSGNRPGNGNAWGNVNGGGPRNPARPGNPRFGGS
ncbi:hypothetical protein HYY75_05815 [bacterium]|nr:hypothetical protein [bacterium]